MRKCKSRISGSSNNPSRHWHPEVSRIFVFLYAPIIVQSNKVRASAPIRMHLCREKREQRDRGLIKKRERTFGERGANWRRREGREMCSNKDLPRWWRDCRAKQDSFRIRSHILPASRHTAVDESEKKD